MTLGLYIIFGLGVVVVSIAGGNAISGLFIAAIIGVVLAPFLSLACSIRFGLLKKKRWAWIVGVVFFAVQIPTSWFPFGVAGLWGLLHPGTRAHFRAAGTEINKAGTEEYAAIVSAILSLIVIIALVVWVRSRMEARKVLAQELHRARPEIRISGCR